ncbi:MAG: glycosyltransferase [Candidatus Micrarchaeaceae archaeon]
MAGLKIAMINGIRPMKGSGDGITEYAYNMYLQLRKRNSVDLVYAIERARKNDALGLLKVNSVLAGRVRQAARKGYDIFHIVNQEVGFAAKEIKRADGDARVVTTIHDMARFQSGLSRGMLQKAYNRMVRRSIEDAVNYSDFLLFDSKQTMADVRERFGKVEGEVVNIGIEERFFGRIPIKKRKGEMFVVGYLGSFAYHKNVMMLMKAARLLRGSGIEFRIYGVGSEGRRIEEYAKDNGLGNVRLMGFAGEKEKVRIYDSFDVFVFPSMYEGFGLPILEAQARGLPVIIYKMGKIPEEVGRYCLKAEDDSHMAQMIEGIKKGEYSGAKRAKALEYARGFSWGKCAKETLKNYNIVLNM